MAKVQPQSDVPAQTRQLVRFRKLAEAKLDSTYNIIISERSDGRYSVAQYVDVYHPEQKASRRFFVGNAIVVDEGGLFVIRETVDKALSAIKVLASKDEEARETSKK